MISKMSENTQTFWFDYLVKRCCNTFGWSEGVAALAITSNPDCVRSLLQHYNEVEARAKIIESVYSKKLKEVKK